MTKKVIAIAVLLVVVITSIIIFPNKSSASWFSAGSGAWNYRQKVTIDHTKVGYAISLIDHGLCGGNNCTTGAMNTSGATLLVATVNCFNQNIDSAVVSDSKSNTWRKIPSVSSGSLNGHTVIWYAYNKSGGALSVGSAHTISASSCSLGAVNVSAYSGTLTSDNPLDVQRGLASQSSGNPFQAGNITPNQNNELVITAIGGNITSYSISTGFTITDTVSYGSTTGGGSAFSVQSAASATNPAWTMQSGGSDVGAVVASFKAAQTNTTLTNFPVLISTTNSAFKSVANGGHVGLDSGNDIVFTSGDGKTKLAHEIEKYDPTTGQIIAWVKVPSLSSKIDGTVYMYYGNGAETGNEQNVTGTWDSNYKGIWHLPNGTTLSYGDSTSNTNTGTTPGNAPTVTTGQIDGGATFASASNQYVSVADSASLQIERTDTVTWEAWINPTSLPSFPMIIQKMAGTATYRGWQFYVDSGTTKLSAVLFNDTSTSQQITRQSLASVSTGTWTHVVVTYDGSSGSSGFHLYVNGVLNDGTSNGATISATTVTSDAVNIGRRRSDTNLYWNGKMDEIRVSKGIARSADWIKTEYNNQNSPSTFVVFSGEETQPTAQTNSSWYNNNWTYRKKIIINHQQVAATTTPLTNFPVLVSITSDPLLAYTGSGGHVASSTAGDIIFTNANGVALNYEIEKYTSTTGELVAWVQIPSLSYTADTIIYMYYGNASAPNVPASTAQNTWDSNYKGVWHLPNGTTLTSLDSTSNGYNLSGGVGGRIPTVTTGQIDGGANFVAASEQYFVNSSFTEGSANITVSVWANSATLTTGDHIFFEKYQVHANWEVFVTAGVMYLRGNGGSYLTCPAPSNSVWHLITAKISGTTGTLYIDGTQCNTGAVTATLNNTAAIYLGVFDGTGYFFNGKMDEWRISNIARSAVWIKTEYNNQSSPSTFETVAGEETQTGTTVNNNWYSSAWGYRKSLMIDKRKVSTVSGTTLTNFPVLVSFTDPQLKFTSSGGLVASSTGADILFTASDGKTKLNHEIEKYDSTTGQVIAWVQIPTLSPSTDTQIYMYFGSTPNAPQQNAASTWDSNYKGVWHLPNGTTLTANDSTSNGNNGTVGAGLSASTGQIDGGASYPNPNGSENHINITANNSLNTGTAYTLSIWFNIPNIVNASQSMLVKNVSNIPGLRYNPVTQILTAGYDQYGDTVTTSASAGTWHLATLSHNGNDAYLYLDGSLVNTANPGYSGSFLDNADVTIGGYFYSVKVIGGKLDEARVSNSIRSTDWIKTEYLNQSSPQTFYAVGPLQIENRLANKAGVATVSRGAGNWTVQTGAWTNRRTIAINPNKISTTATTTLYGFPMLFSSTDPEFKYTGSGGKVGKSDGTDIFFTSSDGVTKLAHEIESYTSTTGQVIAWVNIPVLTQGTYIYMYYGNASASDMQTVAPLKAAVWDSNYKGVYHLPNGATLSVLDSTSNARNGTNNSATAAAGQIDGGLAAGSGTVNVDLGTGINVSGSFTLSAWVKLTANTFVNYVRGIVNKGLYAGDGNGDAVLALARANNSLGTSGTGRFIATVITTGGTFNAEDTVDAPTGAWYFLTSTWDGSNLRFYKNGVLVTTTGTTGTVTNANKNFMLAGYPGGGAANTGLNGSEDEARISTGIARPADWIKTEYNNQVSPSTFYTISGSNPNARASSTPFLKSRGGVITR